MTKLLHKRQLLSLFLLLVKSFRICVHLYYGMLCETKLTLCLISTMFTHLKQKENYSAVVTNKQKNLTLKNMY